MLLCRRQFRGDDRLGRSGVLFCSNTLRVALDLKWPVLLKHLICEQGGGEHFLDCFSICLATCWTLRIGTRGEQAL